MSDPSDRYFEERELKTKESKVQIKKTTSNSNDFVVDKRVSKSNFEEKADKAFNKIQDFRSKAWDLCVKFKGFIENRVLPSNKSPIAVNLEKEVLDNLIKLSDEMNLDETQDDFAGSNIISMLLMKCMLLQRDKINQLNFEIDELKKQINKK